MSRVSAEADAADREALDGRWLRWAWWAALVLIAISRVLALFDGPWEADEALFSLGVLDFHVPGHRPHPPGFPGFVLSGRVIAWVVGDPLLALRLLSIVGSLLGLVAMNELLRRLVSAPIAAITTVAFAFVPGVWAHSARAFTTTTALALVLAAGWVWMRRRERGEPEPGPWPWLLLAYALTMRPQLAVPLAAVVLALSILAVTRAGPKVLMWPAIWAGVAALVVTGVYLAVAIDSGGIDAYLDALRQHVGRHARAIETGASLPALEQLCLVRVMGGIWGFAAIVAVAGVGAVLAFRVSVGAGLINLVAIVVITASLLYAHHPAFPRYSVIWVAALVPGVALSFEALASSPRRWSSFGGLGTIAGVVATIAGVVASWPAIAYMRSHALPAVAAIDVAVAEGASELLHSPGSSPFVRLLAEVPRTPGVAPMQLRHAVATREQRPDRQAALLQLDAAVLDGATVLRSSFEIDSPAARRLGQDRYDRAVLVRQGVLLGAEMYQVERDPSGGRFVWLGDRAELLPPAGLDDPAQQLMLELLVVSDRAPQRVEAACDGTQLGAWTLDAGPTTLALPLGSCRGAVELALPDARAGGREARLLSLRLVRAWVEGPGITVPDASWSLGDREALAALAVELDGFYNPENFGSRRGRWMAGAGQISFPAEPGTIELVVARPPFLEAEGEVVIEIEGDRYVGGLDDQPMTIRLETAATTGRVQVELRGPSFRPSDRRAASKDRRELGMIVYEVRRARRR